MADDDRTLLPLVAEALRDLCSYVADRPADATFDDDVRALESTAEVLGRVASEDRAHLAALLGDRHAYELGIADGPDPDPTAAP